MYTCPIKVRAQLATAPSGDAGMLFSEVISDIRGRRRHPVQPKSLQLWARLGSGSVVALLMPARL